MKNVAILSVFADDAINEFPKGRKQTQNINLCIYEYVVTVLNIIISNHIRGNFQNNNTSLLAGLESQ